MMKDTEIQREASECLRDFGPVVRNYDDQSVATACCFLLCRIVIDEMTFDEAVEKFRNTWRVVQRERGIQ